MEVSSWENHLFLWAIYTMAMLNNQMVYDSVVPKHSDYPLRMPSAWSRDYTVTYDCCLMLVITILYYYIILLYYITILYYYIILLYYITILYYYIILLYYITILYYYIILLYYITILYYYIILLYYITIFYYYIILLYSITILYYYIILLYYITILWHAVCHRIIWPTTKKKKNVSAGPNSIFLTTMLCFAKWINGNFRILKWRCLPYIRPYIRPM